MQHPLVTGNPLPDYHSRLAQAADRTFLLLGLLMGATSLGMALWNGQWLPFLALTLPSLGVMTLVVRLCPGTLLSRNTVALVLMALVAIMIQQSGGLVEMHFGVFVVLALLLYYRDWRPVVVSAAAIALHHVAFFWMQTSGMPVRAFAAGSGVGILLLHALYVVVEAGFVCVMARAMRRQVDILGANPEHLQRLADDIAHDRDTDYTRAWNLSPGSLASSLLDMQDNLHRRQQSEKALNLENAQIRSSLDASRTGMMIADADHIIRYANRSVLAALRHQEKALREAFPDFDVDGLIGTSIHRFHKNPDRIRTLLNSLTGQFNGNVQFGHVRFAQVVTPVFGPDGQRLGFAVEWTDRTEEIAMEDSISGIVEQASLGNFTQRLDLSGTEGFQRILGTHINALLENVAAVTGDVRRMLERLADGDLTSRIERDYAGDLQAMKEDANLTAERLGRIVFQIQQATNGIRTAASEIAAGNDDLSVRTEQQAANLEETAASMEELTSTVHHNAEAAIEANQLANGAADVAARGGQVVEQVVATMDEISQSSRRIADIISVIDGIAFQTNILALNAAVEAARAGEQGRGFAVVAGEVRTLAQRSATAAKEIKALIEDSVHRVNHGSQLVGQAGSTMREIVDSVRQVNTIMTNIASGSQEQSQGIEQINRTIADMDAATQQNAALVEEASAAARALQQQAEDLGQAVSVFHFNGQTAGATTAVAGHADPCANDHAVTSFETMIQAHLGWKLKLKDYLAGRGEQIDPETAGKDNVCAMGQWIHGRGQQVADLPQFQALQQEHARFHRLAAAVIRHHLAGEHAQASQLLEGDFTRATQSTVAAIRHLRMQVERMETA